LIAGGFGCGCAPLAPGTVASVVAVAAGAAMLLVSPWLVAGAAVLATVGGYAAVRAARVEGDPGWVVVDEFAGQWITLVALSRPSWLGLAVGFVLFRLLDVTKLGPIGWADRQHGVFGIMMDDVIAGVIAALLLAALRFAYPAASL
jgi:phosphatidylglycerophosphatase A